LAGAEGDVVGGGDAGALLRGEGLDGEVGEGRGEEGWLGRLGLGWWASWWREKGDAGDVFGWMCGVAVHNREWESQPLYIGFRVVYHPRSIG